MKKNKFLSFTKIQIKDFLSRYINRLNIGNKKVGVLALGFFLVWLWSLYIGKIIDMMAVFQQIGYPNLVINLSYLGAVIFMFFTSLPFVMAVFFYAKDTRFIISLPVKENTIIYGKLSSVYIYLLGISCFILAPAVVVYGWKVDFSIITVITGILGVLLVPLLPILVSTLLVLPLSKFVGGKRNRNILSVIGGILMMGLILTIQQLFLRMGNSAGDPAQFLSQVDLLEKVGARFPPSIWFTRMIEGSLINFLIFLGLNLVLILFLNWMGEKLYRTALMAHHQSADTRRGKIYYRQKSMAFHMIKRHFMIIFNEPTFLLNALSSMFFPVIVFVVMYFAGDVSLQLLNSPALQPYLSLVFAGVITAPIIASNISVTPITREGKRFWETKILPISSWQNLRYRILTTVIFNLTGAVIIGFLLSYLMTLNWKAIILGGLIHLTANLLFSTVDMMINIERPLLDWNNPSAAVKNNINSLYSLVPRAGVGIVIFAIFKFLDISPNLFAIILVGVFAIGYLIARNILKSIYVKKFDNITA